MMTLVLVFAATFLGIVGAAMLVARGMREIDRALMAAWDDETTGEGDGA